MSKRVPGQIGRYYRPRSLNLFMGNPSHGYGALPATWDHTVLLTATRQRWTRSTRQTTLGIDMNHVH